ncbi:MAG: response regulator [Proteobacteria bacterium]|nr:response regulator [Pseudomonadota bacterium]
MKSLARKFLISVVVMTASVTAIASVVAYSAFQRELVNHQITSMTEIVKERASKEGRRFSDLKLLYDAADTALRRRVAALSDAQANRLFDYYFPRQADGTRRSRPDSFDGMSDQEGHYSHGMGAYIPAGHEISIEEKKALIGAYGVVSQFGEAVRNNYDNLYFFTPTTHVVMYGPDRKDKLAYYRKTAPASLDVSKEEMTQITLPSVNAARTIRCTRLRALLNDRSNTRMAVACSQPFDIQGRHIGAFGSSIQLSGYLANAVADTVPGASNLIIAQDGGLIAYPGFSKPGVASPETVRRFEREMRLSDTVQAIRAQKRDTGVIESPDGKDIVAYGRLKGPQWWFLISYPRAELNASAARSAGWILVLGLVASLVQAALVMVLARRWIVTPLRRLAESAGWKGRRRNRISVADIEARDDEIGVLAKALRHEREKVENLLASLEDRVRKRTAELETANREKSRFLANMSHELRTPLNGVVAVSEVLAREQKTKKNRELAELVVSSGRLLEQVLTDILDFSKIEAGQMSVDPCDFELDTVVSRVAELHRAVAEQKGLKLDWSVSKEAKGRWRGDPVRITQILTNLMSNAVKFTAAGEVSLAVEVVKGVLHVKVRDTGVGFDESFRKRLFKRFQQADASVTRRFGGTGLGLSISGSLAELMGGTIEAASTPGKGSTFTLILPLERAQEPVAAESGPAAERAVTLDGARILLAEDHPTNQKVARLILEAAGVELTAVENGALALEQFKSGGFDLVLMDMQMPEMDGLTATREIRSHERSHGARRTPLIMLTANALDEHVKASHEAGADRHVSKPLRPNELLAAISELLAGGDDAVEVEAA